MPGDLATGTSHASRPTDRHGPGRDAGVPRRLGLLGPAFVAAIAYVDPGNFATNFTAGATEGYALLWVVVAANLMAAVIQYLAARLGVATGRDLASACRDHYPAPLAYVLWAVAELICMATDLAEVVGSALALRMLFGLPLIAGGLLTGAVAFAGLAVLRDRQRGFERVMALSLAVILLVFVVQSLLADVHGPSLARGLVPGPVDGRSVLLVTGIVGATVMPHAIYAHSALAQRLHDVSSADRSALLRAQRGDVGAAMTAAGAGNLVILAVAAALLYGKSSGDVSLEEVHSFLAAGHPVVAGLFGVALLVSGVAASGVGTYAGQVVMRGFLRVSVPLTVRRLVTLAPALAVLGAGVDPTRALLLSQVALSFGVPFALIPLLLLTGRADVMGDHAVPRRLTVVAGMCVTVIVLLNCTLLAQWL